MPASPVADYCETFYGRRTRRHFFRCHTETFPLIIMFHRTSNKTDGMVHVQVCILIVTIVEALLLEHCR